MNLDPNLIDILVSQVAFFKRFIYLFGRKRVRKRRIHEQGEGQRESKKSETDSPLSAEPHVRLDPTIQENIIWVKTKSQMPLRLHD